MFDLTNSSAILLKFILIYKYYLILGFGLLVILILGVIFWLKKSRTSIKKGVGQLDQTDNLLFMQKMYGLDKEQQPLVIPGDIFFQINKLVQSGEEIKDILRQIEKKQAQLLNKQTERMSLTLDERIYQAYKDGLGLSELAAEFGRSKGEVELILNLYKSKLKEGKGL